MPSQPELREKRRFFEDLDRLAGLAGDSDDGLEARTKKSRDANVSESFPARQPPSRKRRRPENEETLYTLPPQSPNQRRPRTAPSTHDQPQPSLRQVPTLQRTQTTGSMRTRSIKAQPEEIVPDDQKIFRGLVLFFIPMNDPSKVREGRRRNATGRGARCPQKWTSEVTHVVVNNGLHTNRAVRELPEKRVPENVHIVNADWLAQCISWSILQEVGAVRFRVPGAISNSSDGISSIAPKICEQLQRAEVTPKHIIDPVESGPTIVSGFTQVDGDDLDQMIAAIQAIGPMPEAEEFLDNVDEQQGPETRSSKSSLEDNSSLPSKGFLCMQKHDGSFSSPNLLTMTILQEMGERLERIGDQWRPLAYRKAVTALRQQSELIQTKKQAQAIRGIGESIAAKIEEIQTTGRLRRLDNAKASKEDRRLSLFMGIYGCGLRQAQCWVEQGYRTLEDLDRRANLTPNQRIGIDHYNDFKSRIPRGGVEQHADIVRAAVSAADSDVHSIIGGSYRRGNLDSGDIDVLITKEGASMEYIRSLMTETVIPTLRQNGFLKAELATSRELIGSKWHGASAVPGLSTWRRLDLLYVPGDEVGAALIYFTGNNIFNRSIRLLAGRKGMRLNQHGLYDNVMRGKGRVKLTEGKLLEGKSEKRIFELLGVTYRPPEHRKP